MTLDPTCSNGCTYGQRECNLYNQEDTSKFTKLMVVGGEFTGGDVEIVDLSGDRKTCIKPSNHNYDWGALGMYFDGFATVCGGYGGTSNCYRYNINSNTWDNVLNTNVGRYDAAGSFLSNNEWWISGGSSSGTSSEILNSGESTFRTSVNLPESMADHTMVRVNNSYVIFVGNSGAGSGSNRVYEFKSSCQCFSPLPSQTVSRKAPAAGLVKRPNGWLQVVIAGGLSAGNSDLASSEVYDIESQTWSTGPNLPSAWYVAASVPFGDTFLVVGGDKFSGSSSNNIYEFDPAGNSWITRQEKLSLARYDHTAFFVPDEVAQCH